MIAFFDASALIYLIEGREPFATRVRRSVASIAKRYRTIDAAVCRLTWLECRVQPMKSGDLAVLAAYDAFFARPDLVWVEMTREVVERATAIRVRHGLKTPDALQAAACLELGARHLFLTGDAGFRRVTGLKARILA